MMQKQLQKANLLYLVTEDWYFWSHRSNLARAAQKAGYTVAVATRGTGYSDAFDAAGIRQIPLILVRSSLNPFKEFLSFWQILQVYRQERPDLVHHVALKPVIYGSVAAWLTGVPAVVNAIAGLGSLFTSEGLLGRIRRIIFAGIYRFVLRLGHGRTIVQNPDDRTMLTEQSILPDDRVCLIRGSGVDVELFASAPPPAGQITVMLASRLLWNKGVGEFVEAARQLRGNGYRFVLVGEPDEENPTTIRQEIIKGWVKEGVVEWWGHQDDMHEVLPQAHIVVLPSYREGLPKVLIEAAAVARPLIATDVPGCREIVHQDDNGLLVPVKDANALAEAIRVLAQDPELRAQMGERGRELVVQHYAQEIIIEQTLALYEEVLRSD